MITQEEQLKDHAHTGLDSQRIYANSLLGLPLTVNLGGTGLDTPGASGNVLTSNGTSWASSTPTDNDGTVSDFSAGETLASGEVVCSKPSYSDISPSDDAYVYGGSTGTNYGTDTLLKTGKDISGNDYYTFIKFAMTNVPATGNILKAELRVRENTENGTPPSQTIYRVSGADWVEGTITYTNMPTTTDDIASVYGMEKSKSAPGAGNWVVYDITQLVRQWKASAVNNYGIMISGASGNNDHVSFDSKEAVTTANRPVLRIYSAVASDGKLYKADCDDYLLCGHIVGVTQESAITDAQCSTKMFGKITNINTTNSCGNAYLGSTAGAITATPSGLARSINLGHVVAEDTIIFNPPKSGILIEKLYSSLSATSGARTFYVPVDSNEAIIYLKGGTHDTWQVVRILRDNSGLSTLEVQDASISSAVHQGISVVWTNDYITIDPDFVTCFINNIYLYT